MRLAMEQILYVLFITLGPLTAVMGVVMTILGLYLMVIDEFKDDPYSVWSNWRKRTKNNDNPE